MGLAERLKGALSEKSVTQVALAKAVGVSQPTVNDWLTGKTKTIRGDTMMKVAHFLGVNAKWLASGVGSAKASAEPWPFEMVSKKRFEALTERQRGAVEAALLTEIERLEVLSKTKIAA